MLDHALAYIDPGSGSLIIQVIIASILAVPYFMRTQIGRVVDTIRGRKRPAETATDSNDESQPESKTTDPTS